MRCTTASWGRELWRKRQEVAGGELPVVRKPSSFSTFQLCCDTHKSLAGVGGLLMEGKEMVSTKVSPDRQWEWLQETKLDW